jgi:hypothetical protein
MPRPTKKKTPSAVGDFMRAKGIDTDTYEQKDIIEAYEDGTLEIIQEFLDDGYDIDLLGGLAQKIGPVIEDLMEFFDTVTTNWTPEEQVKIDYAIRQIQHATSRPDIEI